MEYLKLNSVGDNKNPTHKFGKTNGVLNQDAVRYTLDQVRDSPDVAVCIEDGYYVLDLDIAKTSSLEEFTGEWLPMNVLKNKNINKFLEVVHRYNVHTLHYRTASGGYHFWFKYDKSHKNLKGVAGNMLACGLFADSRKSANNQYVRIKKDGVWLVNPEILESKELNKQVADLPRFLHMLNYQFKPESKSPLNVSEGQRNITFSAMVKLLADNGFNQDEISEAMMVANSILDEPVSEEELKNTILSPSYLNNSVENSEKPKGDKVLEMLEELARTLIKRHSIKVVTDEACDRYLLYAESNRTYVQIGKPFLEKSLFDNFGIKISSSPANVSTFKQLIADLAETCGGRRLTLDEHINERLTSTRVLCIDQTDYVITQTGLKSTTKDKVLRFKLGFKPVAYDVNSPAIIKVWTWFCQLLDREDKRVAFFEMLGNILDPYNNLHAFYLLTGTGANGKSFVMEHLVKKMLEPINHEPIRVRQLISGRFETADLENKLLGYDDDMEQIRFGEISVLKQLSGSRDFKAERKGVQGHTIPSTATIVASVNHLPTFRDTGSSLSRRLQIIRFSTCFKSNHTIRISADDLDSDEVRSFFLGQALYYYQAALVRDEVIETSEKLEHLKDNMEEIDDVYRWKQDTLKTLDDILDKPTTEVFANFQYLMKSQMTSKTFVNKLREHFDDRIITSVKTIDGKSTRVYKLKEN